jgi:hypothetical protein
MIKSPDDPMMRFLFASAVVVMAAFGSGCQAPVAKAADPEIAWRSLGSWSGRGNVQTESFTSDSGSIRVQWKASDGPAAGPVGTGGKGADPKVAAPGFRLTIHSAISGRPLMEAVDQQGAGAGTAFVHEDPRVFFAVVESAGLEWSFSLQEAVLVERKRP